MTVYTDHYVVKAILETCNHNTGKHAHWWTPVYGAVTGVIAETITSLLESCPSLSIGDSFLEKQQKDVWILDMTLYSEHGKLSQDEYKSESSYLLRVFTLQ